MQDLGKFKSREFLEFIKSAEKLIEEEHIVSLPRFEDEQKYQPQSTDQSAKYCCFHRSTVHDSAECRALKQRTFTQGEKGSAKRDGSRNVIHLSHPNTSSPSLAIEIQQKRTHALLDTVSSRSLISELMCEQIDGRYNKTPERSIWLQTVRKCKSWEPSTLRGRI